MTNEELAIEIQNGRAGYGQLWEQTHRFIRKQAYRFFTFHGGTCEQAGVELDDLIQCGFLALQDGVQAYSPESGYKLLSFVTRPLKTRFREVCGIRTSRRDPLNCCDSLDREVAGDGADGDITLGELQEDKQSAAMMEDIIERAYQGELHTAIDQALSTLSEDQRDILHRRYWNRQTLDSIAAERGEQREQVRQNEQKAMRLLRKPAIVRLLDSFHDEMIITHAWRGTGWGAWNSAGASSVERAVEKANRGSPLLVPGELTQQTGE